MRFVKAHGAGNDFVLLPDFGNELALSPALVRGLCDRHTGIGADGVIRLAPGRDGTDVFMDYWNADGSVAEMCGNGVRCVAKYVADRGLAPGDVVHVDTRDGVKPVMVAAQHPDGTVAAVRVAMGMPMSTGPKKVDVSPARLVGCPWSPPLGIPGLGELAVTTEQRFTEVTTVCMGNPHAVVVVDDVEQAPVAAWGPVIEHDDAFPRGTNVEFISVPSRDRVVGRIWERGVGETQASGTGASAMAAAAHLLDLADRKVTVVLPGGELAAEWTDEGMFITGPAVEIAEGRLRPEWLDSR
ncbi:MAG TPA: diaminopimelate epimerase [Egibacteraceae bacterium]|jgi:diaminopimelate epimerase|nr:diaminopimelate epimerase [Egibacteraceae bacterium]